MNGGDDVQDEAKGSDGQGKALIMAGGRLNEQGKYRFLWSGPFQWIIAADSGARHALASNILPSVLIGDMDSIDDRTAAAFSKVPVHPFPGDQYEIDSHLGIRWALDQGARYIVLAGGLGSRFDHSLANAQLLTLIHDQGAQGVVTDGDAAVYLLRDELHLTLDEGTVLSVLPLGPCYGLTIRGLRWPLDDYDLFPGDTRTVSNEFTNEPALLSLKEGMALVIVGS